MPTLALISEAEFPAFRHSALILLNRTAKGVARNFPISCSQAYGESCKQVIYKDENGDLIGPFGPALYTPSIVHPLLLFLVPIARCPGLPPKAREAAIIATRSVYQSPYELYSHVGGATTTTNLTAARVEAATNGTKPSGEDGLDEQCDVAFDVAIELANKKGPCPTPLGRERSKRLVKKLRRL